MRVSTTCRPGGAWFALSALVLALGCSPADPTAEGGDEESGFATSTGGEFETPEATDFCEAADEIIPGRWRGTFRDTDGEGGGACGLGGRDAFFRLEIPQRADLIVEAHGVGFVPRIGVSPHGCASEEVLACSEGLPLVVHDLRAGSELILAVGVDDDDPVFDQPVEGQDPLAFVVDLDLRRVLLKGEFCLPTSRGRCVGGTACLGELEVDEAGVPTEDEVFRCRALEAEHCETAQALEIEEPNAQLLFDPRTPHRDDHVHSCTGHRMRERVYRLSLSDALLGQLGPDAIVRVEAEDPEVALALRGPGCVPEDERGCAPPELDTGAMTRVETSTEPVFVFVEYPESDEAIAALPDMLTLTITVVDG